mgnify:CR=1 FL=1
MHRPGFSLLEVLVAISIILILMALSLPGYYKALHKAHETHDSLSGR